MPTYNRNFDLSVEDIAMIEERLRERGRELCRQRRALSEENPADLAAIRAIEIEQREQEELLGRLHDQKVFYRPKDATYVSG